MFYPVRYLDLRKTQSIFEFCLCMFLKKMIMNPYVELKAVDIEILDEDVDNNDSQRYNLLYIHTHAVLA